jgi:mannose-6-phosphate isomerase
MDSLVPGVRLFGHLRNPPMASALLSSPIFFDRNRVARVYRGGLLFGDLFGDEPIDGYQPEEWIASSVRALNRDSSDATEGLSRVRGTDITFDALLRDHPMEMTGGTVFDVLVKALDSAVRLPAQAHPDKEFSRRHFRSEHGKTEMWLILATRPGANIYFGFKEGVTRADLERAVKASESDKHAFEGLLEEWEAVPGDVWLIPAKAPHAIGAGCLILEVQEPTDFTLQPERWCDTYELNDHEMYLGLAPDIALDCFDLSMTGKEVLRRARIAPKIVEQRAGYTREILISHQDTPCFAVNRHSLDAGSAAIAGPAVFVASEGEGELRSGGQVYPIRRGDYFFLPCAAGQAEIFSAKRLQIVECLPPKGS